MRADSSLGPGHLARLALGDMRERMRQPGYLISLLVMVWLGHGMLPPVDAGYRTFVFQDIYRPFYDAEWVGTLTAVLTGLYLQLVGFYIVRGTIERDRRSGVGQILAASRVGRFSYLLSKAVSHLLVLLSMTAVVAIAALVMQQVRAEDTAINLSATLRPFLFVTVPVAAMVAAGAVLFDSTPGLRGGFGNVAWFFLLAAFMGAARLGDREVSPYRDLFAAGIVGQSVREQCERLVPETRDADGSFSVGVNINPRWRDVPVRPFAWEGLDWSGHRAAARGMWLLIALGVVALACVPFDRFQSRGAAAAMPRDWLRLRRRPEPEPGAASFQLTLSGASLDRSRPRRLALVAAECALLLRGQGSWWYLGVLGLLVAALVSPLTAVRHIVLPLAAFWPVFVWSSLGMRESRDRVAPLLFSCAQPVSRLVPATWTAGALIGLLIGATGVLRLGVAGEWAAVCGWLLCSVMAPTFAFACGAWSGQSRLFEVAWLFLWYVGSLNRAAPLDVSGVATEREPWVWGAHAAFTIGMMALGWVGRARQLQR